MNSVIDIFKSKLALLQPRERTLLVIGAWLLSATAVFVLVTPMVTKQNELASKAESIRENLNWLQEQRSVVVRLQNNCASNHSHTQLTSTKGDFERLTRRNQLSLDQSTTKSNGGTELTFSGSDANRVMHLVHELACEGFVVESLDIQRSADGKIKGAMEVASVES